MEKLLRNDGEAIGKPWLNAGNDGEAVEKRFRNNGFPTASPLLPGISRFPDSNARNDGEAVEKRLESRCSCEKRLGNS